jgi:D-serine dehydratase
MDLATIEDERLSATSKGIPHQLDGVRIGDVGRASLNLLADDFPFPAAVLKKSAIDANIRLLAGFARAAGIHLAPHGKTTMAPQIFADQLAVGAWGLTCATSAQLRLYRQFGVDRIIMANQLLDPQAIAYIAAELERDEAFEFYGIVDSSEGVERYAAALRPILRQRRVNILIEAGCSGGRSGVRSLSDAVDLARLVASNQDVMVLAGIEAFEGVYPGTPREAEVQVAELLRHFGAIARRCGEEGLFGTDEVILTAGGSGYFDLVARGLKQIAIDRPVTVVLRSGCYVTHDHGFYNDAVTRLRERAVDTIFARDSFTPALEVWAMVQSVPQHGLALVTLGKRDASFDLGLPMPLRRVRPGDQATLDLAGHASLDRLNDHHGYLRIDDLDVAIGDLVAFGISHPCTTFDRWTHLHVVSDDYDLLTTIRTFF